MRKISAHLILDGRGNCFSKGILTIDSDGTILDIKDTCGNLQEEAGIELTIAEPIHPKFVSDLYRI